MRALISVSDKTGIVEFAKGLAVLGVEIISTGGTAVALQKEGLKVTGIQEVTQFPEMLDGRVKTLHPAVHGGLLARRDLPEHMSVIAEHGIEPIDIVCVNLYPFAATIQKPGVEMEEVIENIDIGGPAMIRSAAKNHDSVTVVVDSSDYGRVLEEMGSAGTTSIETRRRLAARAYAHTACYDAMISNYLQKQFAPDEPFAPQVGIGLKLAQACRYGENPHQNAAFYRVEGATEPSVSMAKQLHGKELSFNNFYDLNAALETVKEFAPSTEAAAVIIKHTNPCGAALGSSAAEAFRLAREGDPISAFGGILAMNCVVDVATADEITGKNTFFEAIIAPGFEPEAMTILTERKKWGANLRLLEVGDLDNWRSAPKSPDFKRVVGGMLVQDRDLREITVADLKLATNRSPSDEELRNLLFGWKVMRHVKSNAIVFAREMQIVGVGAGQMNRVQSVRLACTQAGEKALGAVVASDAFFPFPDGPQAAIDAGITAIIQPGGSVKDQETIDLCNEHNIAMVLTGVRHFLH
ncbi:MAG: bifunctional phosphoribosylaminoimidazolecarboxamide formyltransferase/IMP cyclohydrolase [Chthonomonadales bacterium]